MTSRSATWLAAGALCIIGFLTYANSFDCAFVLDNRDIVLEDSRVHQVTPENLALIFQHGYWWPTAAAGLYRPVTTLSWLFNYAVLGNTDHPAGYHWINLLLHIGNALLVFALARRLAGGLAPSFLISAIWAVHPVLTESVTNIVGRADLLAGMTTLAGLLIHLKNSETHGLRRSLWLAGLTAVTTVGVFSKESAVAVLAVIALYELTWWDPRRLPGFLLSAAAMSPAFLAMWWARSRIFSAEAPTVFSFVDNPIAGGDFWIGRLTAAKVVAKYLGLLVWPAHLSADYSYAQIPLVHGGVGDWAAWIAVAAAGTCVAFLYRRNKTAFFAAGFAFVTLLPASNLLIPVGTIMAERFLYLPAIGMSVCTTLALYSVGRRLRMTAMAPFIAGLLIVTSLGARTVVRNRDWRDDFAFWSAAVRTAPLSFKTHMAFGKRLLSSDPTGLAAALREEERGLAILDPLPDRLNDAESYYLLGGLYTGLGDSMRRRAADGSFLTGPESISRYERARALLLRAVSIMQAHRKSGTGKPRGLWGEQGDPKLISDVPAVYTDLMLSRTEERLGRIDESIQWAREAQSAGPMRAAVYERFHEVFLARGRSEEARSALLEGVLLTSDPGLKQSLVEDYANHPGSGCEISYAEAVPSINPSCGTVRKQACLISDDVIRIALKAGSADVVARLKNELRVKYGCQAGEK